jgi:hypothetical protein
MKAPAVQWYFGDWLRCAELRLCSLEARGLWIDMLGFMHQAQPYGHLVFQGKAVDAKRLANMVGGGTNASRVGKLLKELGENGVYSVDDNGVMYCRRMVRDELTREAWRLEKQQQRGGSTPKVREPSKGPDKRPDTPLVSGGMSGQSPPVLHSAVLPSQIDTPPQETPAPGGQAVDNPIAGQEPGTATALKPSRWWESEAGWIEEGKRRGVEARTGEPWDTFRQRVKAAKRPRANA